MPVSVPLPRPQRPKPTGPAPPKHLKAATRSWWLHVTATWELEQHHYRTLSLACRTWDEIEAADALVRTEGLVLVMPSGFRRPHPALRVAREGRILFARLLRELDLDVVPPSEGRRPPSLRSVSR